MADWPDILFTTCSDPMSVQHTSSPKLLLLLPWYTRQVALPLATANHCCVAAHFVAAAVLTESKDAAKCLTA